MAQTLGVGTGDPVCTGCAGVVTIAPALGAAALLFVLDRALLSALDDAATIRAQDITTSSTTPTATTTRRFG